MTQLATAVLAGAAMLLGYKLIQKQTEAVRATARASRPQTGRAQKDLGALVWDEHAGVYRPRG
jgi:hypothetical protein